ncbi:hypothetical protein ACFPYI_21200 [Halomarina salina]|uniref:DUF8160 domain-containing protein n=1 Tax=Halomarina salina TaxID=1872699 RepID=A0ABD5RTG7_9EURY|nr:hypothetical protein [Halomarina salina]
MSDDRASRLRSRRGKARERAEAQQSEAEERERESGGESVDESASATEPADAGATDAATDETTETSGDERDARDANEDEDAGDGSVKEERVGTYMYLPESQKRELQRVYGTLKVQYEYEYDEEFEKNRHFFPAVVRHGLETLDGMDAADVRAVVDDLD